MFTKIFTISALVAYAQAGVYDLGDYKPTSYSSVAPVAHYGAKLPLTTTPGYYQDRRSSSSIRYPIVKAVHKEVYPYTHPQYSYQYGVQNVHTGDVKNQHKECDGDVVKGYSNLV
ncbi:PREDICTED: cuticle protein 19-like [Nicrophorus vespilloides]|uniref:Cuticle protein 19-like n=1 Tax=Nicrophorus vespilloides TaxID=110193 RepID=A0ABM1MSG9_NICVS|nr:PREDICTED: cuticle protein 19-like [Nicrophorus vespilloides]